MLARVVAFATLTAFLFGYDLGLIGGALLQIRAELGASEGAAAAIVGAAKLGAVAGTFLGGALMLYHGRRAAIAVDGAFFAVGPLVMAASPGVAGLVLGRAVVGVGVGVSAVVVPAYLGELAPPRLRGRIVELYEVALCVGMVAAALADAALGGVPHGWRLMVGLPAAPALLVAGALWVLPESPRWLVIHGRLDAALAVIARVHGGDAAGGDATGGAEVVAAAEDELLALWSAVEKDTDAAARRRAALAAERAAARERRATRVAPISGAASAADAAAGSGAAARFERLGGDDDDDDGGGGGGAHADEASPPAAADAETAAILGSIPYVDSTAAAGDDGGGGALRAGAPAAAAPAASPAGAARRRSRQDSREPWTARQTSASRAGLWPTLVDMVLDIYIVARGPERRALRTALWLAFFNQAFASTAVINYAPALLSAALERGAAGGGAPPPAAAALLTAAVGGAKAAGVGLAFFLVDSLGRRPLLVGGSAGCAAALAGLAAADAAGSAAGLLAGMCAFVFAFSLSWAGVFWVLLSELFSMGAKSPAASAATAALFATGAAADLLFLALRAALGPASFLLYAGVAAAAGCYVAAAVPETRGLSLQEVVDVMSADGGGGAGAAAAAGELGPLRAPGGGGGVELPRRGSGGGSPKGFG